MTGPMRAMLCALWWLCGAGMAAALLAGDVHATALHSAIAVAAAVIELTAGSWGRRA